MWRHEGKQSQGASSLYSAYNVTFVPSLWVLYHPKTSESSSSQSLSCGVFITTYSSAKKSMKEFYEIEFILFW